MVLSSIMFRATLVNLASSFAASRRKSKWFFFALLLSRHGNLFSGGLVFYSQNKSVVWDQGPP